MKSGVHSNTPRLFVIDNRSLPVREVAYWRQDINERIAESRLTVQQHDVAGRRMAQRDPRLLAPTARPNLATAYSLSGAVLLTESVDAGWQLDLPGESGRIQERWDGRCSHWKFEHDEQQRLTALHERTQDSALRTLERLTYADNTVEFAERNQCAKVIRHDDTAGTLHSEEYGLLGELLLQKRHFLKGLQSPDWPLPLVSRHELLEPDEGFQTRRHYSPCAELIRQVDARGHRQSWHFDRAGQLQQVRLQLKDDTTEKTLLHSLRYNALGQIESQTAGNGTTTSSQFDPADGRLLRLQTHRPGRGRLQALSYRYDAGGNVMELHDHTQATRYFANQLVEPTNCYTYDSLSQLISATGREALGQSIRPELPDLAPDPGDNSRLLNYTEHYEYDQGGNLTLLRHQSAHPGQAHRRAFKVAEDSNRAQAWDEQRPPDFARGFDANGNLQGLHPHDQRMLWTGQNQLQRITLVSRKEGENDAEHYAYDQQRLRVRKQQRSLASGVMHIRDVRYLPGLEIRTLDDSEHLEVITLEAGRSQVRCLHWVTSPPDDIRQDQLRYSLCDHLGSSTLELDGEADIISHEGYYPYGGTAWWAARSEVEARYKTIRYSGKEQDVSGLYDYGLRYYAPWLCRWICPDPAGDVDGLNVYRMVGGNPLRYVDFRGEMRGDVNASPEDANRMQEIAEAVARYLQQHKHPTDSVVSDRSRLGKTYDTATNVLSRSGRHLVSGGTAIAMSYMSDYFANTPLDNIISFLVGLGISVAYSKLTSILATKQKVGHKAARLRDAFAKAREEFHDFIPSGSQSPRQTINRAINNGIERARHHVENEVTRVIDTANEAVTNVRQDVESAIDSAREIEQIARNTMGDVSKQLDQIASSLKQAGFTAKEVADALMEVKHPGPVTVNRPQPGSSSVVVNMELPTSPKASRKVMESTV